MRSLPEIAFDYRPSRLLVAAVVVVFVLALLAVAACGLNMWIKLALAAATLVYAAWTLRGFLCARFERVTWHSAGHWRLQSVDAEERPGEFVAATVLGPLIALTLRIGPKRQIALLLLPDNCDRETRRRLRVRLARCDVRA